MLYSCIDCIEFQESWVQGSRNERFRVKLMTVGFKAVIGTLRGVGGSLIESVFWVLRPPTPLPPTPLKFLIKQFRAQAVSSLPLSGLTAPHVKLLAISVWPRWQRFWSAV